MRLQWWQAAHAELPAHGHGHSGDAALGTDIKFLLGQIDTIYQGGRAAYHDWFQVCTIS